VKEAKSEVEDDNEGEENFGGEGHRESVRVPPQDSISWGRMLLVSRGGTWYYRRGRVFSFEHYVYP
jgi:hypothetical protein